MTQQELINRKSEITRLTNHFQNLPFNLHFKAILAQLVRQLDAKTKSITWLSATTIASRVGCSEKTVDRHLAAIKQLGFFTSNTTGSLEAKAIIQRITGLSPKKINSSTKNKYQISIRTINLSCPYWKPDTPQLKQDIYNAIAKALRKPLQSLKGRSDGDTSVPVSLPVECPEAEAKRGHSCTYQTGTLVSQERKEFKEHSQQAAPAPSNSLSSPSEISNPLMLDDAQHREASARLYSNEPCILLMPQTPKGDCAATSRYSTHILNSSRIAATRSQERIKQEFLLTGTS